MIRPGPQASWSRLRARWWPGNVVALLLGALLLATLVFDLAILRSLLTPDAAIAGAHVGTTIGLVVHPPTALGLLLLGLLASQPAPRLGLIGGGFAFFFTSLSLGFGSIAVAEAVPVLWLPALAFTVPALFSLALGLFLAHGWLKDELRLDQAEHLATELLLVGPASYADAQLALGLDEDELGQVLGRLDRTSVRVRLDPVRKWIHAADEVRRLQARLCAEVERAGEISVTELARRLSCPPAQVSAWLDELGQAGALEHARAGETITFTPGGRREVASCPSCGGPMPAVGRSLLRCVGCAREVVLALTDAG